MPSKGKNVKSASNKVATASTKKDNGRRRDRRTTTVKLPTMSLAGEGFLKCAFAAPDFATSGSRGIPDRFNGDVLLMDSASIIHHVFEPGTDTYILFAPTPGVMYWHTSVPVGTPLTISTAFDAVYFPDRNSFFPVGAESTNVSKFRYASLAGEIIPNSSLVNTSGSITTQRLSVTETVSDHDNTVQLVPVGLSAAGKYSSNAFVDFPFIDGAYAVSTCAEAVFDFKPIREGMQRIPFDTVLPRDGILRGDYVGMGDMLTICMKASVPAGGIASANIRAWHCVEYLVNPGSPFSPFSHASPSEDPVAMAAYRKLSRELPIAVTRAENAGFWDWVKRTLSAGFSLASAAPNPIVKAVGTLGSAAMGLFQ